GRDGGGAAAPAFREIAQAVLSELNVAPDLEGATTAAETEDIPEAPGVEDVDPVGDTAEATKPNSRGKETQRPKALVTDTKKQVAEFPKAKAQEPARKSPPDPGKKTEQPKGQIKNKSSTARMEYRT
nr:hypothetical protein [Blastocatellia bacterium]